MRTKVALMVVCCAALFGACKEEKNKSAPAPASSLAAAAPETPQSAPTSAPTHHGQQPTAVKAALAGEVLESMNAAGYTYLKIKAAGGERWAAVRKTTVNKGDRVAIVGATVMRNFKSKTLKRTFPTIVFGQLAKPGALAKGGANKLATAHAKVSEGQAKFDKPLKPASSANGRTIAQIYAQRAKLAKKKIAVRGKVTKVNRGILGKNWLHLQDGTGEKGSHDLTVTSQGVANVGDIVVAVGTIVVDKNFGAGYKYPVLLEDATLRKD